MPPNKVKTNNMFRMSPAKVGGKADKQRKQPMILSSKQNSRIDVEGHMKTYKEHGSNSPKKLNSPSNAENKINVRQFLDSKLFFKNAKGQKVKINIIGKKLDDIKTTE